MSTSTFEADVVSICIATYARPDGLRALLESLAGLEVPHSSQLEVVVIDNNPGATAMSTEALALASFGETTGASTVYEVQSEPNISTTRNAAVSRASGDVVWFLDDDQLVRPDCLIELLRTLAATGADGVSGSVNPLFEVEPPDWMRASSTFNRPHEVWGVPSKSMGIANTLIRASVLQCVDGPFDERFGSTGGEDSMLFRRLTEVGVRVVAAPEAVVEERVPESRANWDWMKQRRRRQGQNYLRQIVAISGGRFGLRPLRAVGAACINIAILRLRLLKGPASMATRHETLQLLEANLGKLEGWRGASTEWAGAT